MSGITVTTVKGGQKKTITLKSIKTRLRNCDGNSGWATEAEIDRISKIKDEKIFQSEFNTSIDMKYFYLKSLSNFAIPCIGPMAGDVLKEILMQRVPRKLSGWVGLGIKVIYRSKKKRGLGVEFRYKEDGTIEVWKIEEVSQ